MNKLAPRTISSLLCVRTSNRVLIALALGSGSLSLLLSAVALAQTADVPAPNIRVQSDLVLINLSVTDSRGMPVTDLDVSRFHLFEDGEEQVIQSCSGEDVPVSVGLVLDTSGSMNAKVGLMKSAAVQLVSAANPFDEYFLVAFERRPQVLLPFTRATDELLRSFDQLHAGGSTALFDAVHLAVRQMHSAGYPRKALLIISDGMDNHSRFTERETKRAVSEVDFPIYTINVWEPPQGNRYAVQRRDTGVLEMLSDRTGGRHYSVRDPKKLALVSQLISLEIRHNYVLGFVPTSHRLDGKFHTVRVKVDSSSGQKLKTSNRAGYFAPIP